MADAECLAPLGLAEHLEIVRDWQRRTGNFGKCPPKAEYPKTSNFIQWARKRVRDFGDRKYAAALASVDIATEFKLEGSQFRNMTDFQVQFALSLALLELRMEGVLFSVADGALTWAEIVDLPNHLFLAEFGLDIGNPLQLGRIGSPDGVAFALDGFSSLAGASFQIAAVPEPESWLLFIAGALLVVGATHRARHRR